MNKDQLMDVIISLGIIFIPKPDDRDEIEYLGEVVLSSTKMSDEKNHKIDKIPIDLLRSVMNNVFKTIYV